MKLFTRKIRRLLLGSALHASLLVFLTFWWMDLSWQFSDEIIVAKINQVAKYLVLDKPDPLTQFIKQKLLFVNCSYDKMLVPYEDDFGSGTKVITDRQKLYRFMKNINNAPAKPDMIVFDIILDYESPYDALLQPELRRLRHGVFSTEPDARGELKKPLPGLNYALAQYATTIGSFLKYRIVANENALYVPSAMYTETTGDHFHPGWGIAKSEKGWWLNSFIVDLPIRRAHLDNHEVLVWNLGEALTNFSPEEIQQEISGRIVVFGDIYENDIHDTLLGSQPGPLILVNTYLALLGQLPRIKFRDVALIFLLYFSTTIYILNLKPYQKKILSKNIFRRKAGRFIVNYLSYILIFSLLAIVFYMLTQKHFQLLLFAFYFNLFEFVVMKSRKRKEGVSTSLVESPT